MPDEVLTPTQKNTVINILAQSFNENQSVNYIVKQDKTRAKRIKALMAYSYDICSRFGKVILSNDEKACALLLYPDRKKITIQSIIWDIKLIFRCIGLNNIPNTLRREALVKQAQPRKPMTYIWFIGVCPEEQNKGKGSLLLESILEESKKMKRIVCLETSTLRNLPWYEKFGFKIYHEEEIGYKLYFLTCNIITPLS